MNKKLFLLLLIPVIFIIGVAPQSSQYARRIFPTFVTPATPCNRGSVWYHMLNNKFLICTNNGVEEVGIGVTGGVIPIANSTTTGRLSNTDWTIFNNKQSALGFTPENITNKNASNGYAGLSSGKISQVQLSEVLSILNLTDYATTSGSGSTAIRSTITSAANNDILTWDGSNWVNQAPLMFSVFGRTGIVAAQTGDYTASQVTNAFDKSVSNNLTVVSAPSNPIAGNLAIWADNIDEILKVKNNSGTIAVTVRPSACTGTDKVSSITSAGLIVCTADQTGGGGGGGNLVSLNGLTASDQTFSATDDTNIDLSISSASTIHNFSVAWIGTLAKNRMVASTVHTDQANIFGAFAQTFQSGSLFKLTDATDTTKIAQFDLSNIGTATTRTVNIPNSSSTTVQASTAPTNQFATSISSQGVVGYSQPAFSNLSGSVTDAQIPDSHTVTAISNLTTNGFVKTSSSNGTLSVDTNTYLTTTGNGSALTGIVFSQIGSTVTDAQVPNNITVDLATVATTANAGDSATAFFSTGIIEVARLGSGSPSGSNFLRGDGTWATPSGTGDMVLASTQTVTGAKTFDPTKLIVGSVSTDPTVVIGSFYRDTDDGKLYFGIDDTTDFWGEVFIGGQSLINLASNVTGDLPFANLVQASAASKLIGRGSASGAGDFQEITIGSGLSMSGTTLSATGGGSGTINSATVGHVAIYTGSTTISGDTGLIYDTSTDALSVGGPLSATSLTVNGAAVTNNIPQNSQSTAYTTVIADAGKHLYHPSADTTARTFTIDSNANVAYPVGTAITFVNDCSAGVMTISITSDTLVLAGAGTTGSRTLAACGIATAIKVTSTRWIINGTGLT